uniref:Uncharacterized protein TCIL3000_8_6680 n=1 Tax=Trypanosoma congolense (strain IL3000) TaxID=1068625 RepID=G0USS8_TRYCI|nr:unnamed protein product [Trypanosoma congolense IL3000]
MATCEGPPPTTSTFSTAESMEQPPQQHGLPQLTATTFPDGSSFSATQLSDNTCVAPGKLRRSASQTRTHTLTSAATNVCGDNSPAHTEVYSMIDSGTTETRCNASSRHSVKSHISSEATEVNWAKAALLSLTVRLDRVRPLGHVRGAFTRQLQGILPEIGHSAGGVDTPTGEPSNSDALRLALETRRRLAERVDEYKRRREEMKKRRKLDCTSCFSRSILPPVVIPKPTIISDELLPIADWLIEGTKKQTQLKPSVTASIVGESM